MRMDRITLLILIAAILLPLPMRSLAAVSYIQDIKPILKARCYSCHGSMKQKGGLRLDTFATLKAGGKSGPPLGVSHSLLLAKVTIADESERMPQESSPLSKEEIEKLRQWLAEGASGPLNERPEPDPRDHWAFKPPERAALAAPPPSKNSGTLLDALLGARLASKGFVRQAEISKGLWLRRVYLDTIGVPPSAGELEAFATDASPVARLKVLDRLLASPAFGERWARHLMDLWRYSDWWGLDAQLRYSQKHIWHWRDWIIESLNGERGYDRMILEMLAADELEPENAGALRATGFLCRSYYLFNRTTWLDEVVEHTSRAFLGLTMQCAKCHDHKYDPLEQADYYRMRAVFEPYHVRLDAWPGEPDFEKNGLPRAFDLQVELPTYIHRRGDDRQPETNRVIQAGIPAIFGDLHIKPVNLPVSAHSPGLRRYVLEDQLRAAARLNKDAKIALDQAREKLGAVDARQRQANPAAGSDPLSRESEAALKEARAAVEIAEHKLEAATLKEAAIETAWAADASKQGLGESLLTRRDPQPANAGGRARAAAVADAAYRRALALVDIAVARKDLAAAPKEKKADIEKRLKAAEESFEKESKRFENPDGHYRSSSGALKALVGPDDSFDKNPSTYPSRSTGRRLALAKWISHRNNPLTARVFVNHVWTRVFGDSLVADVSDWGRRAAPPIHQDVLDALAVEFMDHGWELKHLLRILLNSELYRLGSSTKGADPSTMAGDPENRFYWRMNPKRLDSQVIRDGLLFTAGLLELEVGGPPIPVPLKENSHRRALYFQQHGELEHRFLAAFDNSNVFECYRRRESVTPQQALALANSKLTRESSEALEKLLIAGSRKPDGSKGEEADRRFTRAAFVVLLARLPSESEESSCLESLLRLRAVGGQESDGARARSLFLQALMNHNDYVTLR